MNVYNWIRGRILDAEASVYRWRCRRAMKRRAKAARDRYDAPTWFIVAVMFVQLTQVSACVYRARIRSIEAIERRCLAEIAASDEPDAVNARCDREIDAVSR